MCDIVRNKDMHTLELHTPYNIPSFGVSFCLHQFWKSKRYSLDTIAHPLAFCLDLLMESVVLENALDYLLQLHGGQVDIHSYHSLWLVVVQGQVGTC